MNGNASRYLPGIRWWIPILLGVAVLGTVGRGLLVVRESGKLACALETTLQRQSVLEVLYPLYQEMNMAVGGLENGSRLALPSLQVLGRGHLPGLSEMFKGMAAQYGIESGDIRFEVQTDNGQRLLQVALPLKGRYRDLGPLLADLIRLPSLISVDRLSAVWYENGDAIDIELKLALE